MSAWKADLLSPMAPRSRPLHFRVGLSVAGPPLPEMRAGRRRPAPIWNTPPPTVGGSTTGADAEALLRSSAPVAGET